MRCCKFRLQCDCAFETRERGSGITGTLLELGTGIKSNCIRRIDVERRLDMCCRGRQVAGALHTGGKQQMRRGCLARPASRQGRSTFAPRTCEIAAGHQCTGALERRIDVIGG